MASFDKATLSMTDSSLHTRFAPRTNMYYGEIMLINRMDALNSVFLLATARQRKKEIYM